MIVLVYNICFCKGHMSISCVPPSSFNKLFAKKHSTAAKMRYWRTVKEFPRVKLPSDLQGVINYCTGRYMMKSRLYIEQSYRHQTHTNAPYTTARMIAVCSVLGRCRHIAVRTASPVPRCMKGRSAFFFFSVQSLVLSKNPSFKSNRCLMSQMPLKLFSMVNCWRSATSM